MLRKMIVAGSALALLSTVALATPLASHVRCGVNWLHSSASDSVPLEWELKRARQMITDLKPEIEMNAKRIAREKIDVTRIEQQLGETDVRLEKTQADIERLSADLRNGSDNYTYGGRTYTAAQVNSDLSNRFERFKTRKATSEKLNEMLTARKASLRAAHGRMDAMLGAKRQLEVEVENLQARLGALRVAQTTSQLDLEDSQLSVTRKLLDDIKSRIDVEEATMAVDTEYFGEIDLEEPSDKDLLDEISSFLDGSAQNESVEEAFVSIQLD